MALKPKDPPLGFPVPEATPEAAKRKLKPLTPLIAAGRISRMLGTFGPREQRRIMTWVQDEIASLFADVPAPNGATLPEDS